VSAEKAFGIFLNSTIFLAVFELAAGYSFYIFEFSLICLFVSFIFLLFSRYNFNVKKVFGEITSSCKFSQTAVCCLAIYIFYDIATLAYSKNIMLSLSKCKVVALMLFISCCIMLYCRGIIQADTILVNIAAAGIFSSLLAIINAVLLRILPVYYNLRLTLRIDYNVFATVVLISIIVGAFYIVLRLKNELLRHILLYGILAINAPVIFLSGSRRIFIILPFAIILIYFVFSYLQIKAHKSIKKFLLIFLNFIATIASICAIAFMLNSYMQKLYLNGTDTGNGGLIIGNETTPEERYETIASGSFMEKRKILWQVALDELKNYSKTELIFGRGSSYDILMYDNAKSEMLDSAYPDREYVKGKLSVHNMLLADLLNGGIIKLILLIILIIVLAIYYIRFLIADFFTALPYCICIGIVFINNLISNRFGFLYDKYFYIILFLSIIEISFICKNQRRLQ